MHEIIYDNDNARATATHRGWPLESGRPETPFLLKRVVELYRLILVGGRSRAHDIIRGHDAHLSGSQLVAFPLHDELEPQAWLDHPTGRVRYIAQMKKDIRTAIIRRDKPIAFRRVKPLDLACLHLCLCRY